MQTGRAVLVALVVGCTFLAVGCGDEGATGGDPAGPSFVTPGDKGSSGGGGEDPAPNGGVVSSGASSSSSGSTSPTPPTSGADSTKGSGGPTGFSTQTSKQGLK